MPSNRLLATLLASAAILWPVGADAVTVGTLISAQTPQAATTTISITTTAIAPANGTVVVFGGYLTTASAPSLTGCSGWTKGTDINVSSQRITAWYCTVGGSDIASGSTLNQALGVSSRSQVCVIAYPSTAATHDMTSGTAAGATGTGRTVSLGPTSTPAQASEVLVVGLKWDQNEDLTQDSNYTTLCDVYDSMSGGGYEFVAAERVINTVTPTSYSASLLTGGASPNWYAGYESFLYSTGGATCTGARMRQGYGGC